MRDAQESPFGETAGLERCLARTPVDVPPTRAKIAPLTSCDLRFRGPGQWYVQSRKSLAVHRQTNVVCAYPFATSRAGQMENTSRRTPLRKVSTRDNSKRQSIQV